MTRLVRLALMALLMLSGGAVRAVYSYDYSLGLQGSVNPGGFCYSGIAVVPCSQFYQSGGNPLPGFSVGSSSNQVSIIYRAEDGPITTERSSRAEFAMAPAQLAFRTSEPLLRLYLSSDGQRVVTDCIGQICGQANAWAMAVQLQVGIVDNILVNVPARYDGQAVSATFTLPVTASGEGSSYGEITARMGNPLASEHLTFGHLNVTGGHYEVDELLTFEVALRQAGETSRLFTVPFIFLGDFRSSTNNGPGIMSSLNSIGLTASSLDGVVFTSESGFLDHILSVSAVPEVPPYLALSVGALMLAWCTRRARARAV